MNTHLTLILALISPLALAGGSHYGTPAGIPAGFSGQVAEWPVPTPAFARDPAAAPDGSIFIAVMTGNKVARFDPASQSFKEWDLPPKHPPPRPAGRPHRHRVDHRQRQRHHRAPRPRHRQAG